MVRNESSSSSHLSIRLSLRFTRLELTSRDSKLDSEEEEVIVRHSKHNLILHRG